MRCTALEVAIGITCRFGNLGGPDPDLGGRAGPGEPHPAGGFAAGRVSTPQKPPCRRPPAPVPGRSHLYAPSLRCLGLESQAFYQYLCRQQKRRVQGFSFSNESEERSKEKPLRRSRSLGRTGPRTAEGERSCVGAAKPPPHNFIFLLRPGPDKAYASQSEMAKKAVICKNSQKPWPGDPGDGPGVVARCGSSAPQSDKTQPTVHRPRRSRPHVNAGVRAEGVPRKPEVVHAFGDGSQGLAL